MKKIYFLFIGLLLIASCNKNESTPEKITSNFSEGVFIVEEGNFRSGNADVSFYNLNTDTLYRDVFSRMNGEKPGDVAMQMELINGAYCLIVNNSGKIEVLDKTNFKRLKTISGFTSPRSILAINDSTAWVSDLSEKAITVLNLNKNIVSGKIQLKRTVESMLLKGNFVYAAAWRNGNVIYKLDAATALLTDSVVVANEPNSMAIDAENNLWVLSDGGVFNRTGAALSKISLSDFELKQSFAFPQPDAYPSRLVIDNEGKNLYYILSHIYKMNIHDAALPETHFIEAGTGILYGLDIEPGTGNIYISDAGNYISNGSFSVYSPTGNLLVKRTVGIIPAWFTFVGK